MTTDAMDKAAKVLAEASEVALVCHVNPDADAVGSMLGLAGFLAERGVQVAATWPNDHREAPRWIEALPGGEHVVVPGKMPKRPEVVVTLDAADPKRLGGMIHLLESAGISICIDHHRTNPGFAAIDLIDPEASSTGELVYRLIERMGGAPSDDVAACLYAAIVTDTGRFMYEAAKPETLRVAAELRERDFDHAALAQALYEDESFGFLKLLGLALARAELDEELGFVWTHLSRKDLEEAGVEIQETEGMIDVIRSAREADVAAVLKEQRESGYKVSLRSRGGTDVSAIAERFEGGGHRLAAGYSSGVDLEASIAALRKALRDVDPPDAEA